MQISACNDRYKKLRFFFPNLLKALGIAQAYSVASNLAVFAAYDFHIKSRRKSNFLVSVHSWSKSKLKLGEQGRTCPCHSK